MAGKNNWHTMSMEQVCARLETNATKGLSRKQAVARLKKMNVRCPEALQPLFLPSKKTFFGFFGKMLLDPIMLLTFCVAIIALFFGESKICLTIVSILLCNAVRCAFAYAKAYSQWKKLQLYSNPMVKVIRGGTMYTTDARNVLPGDVVLLCEGDICPADVRLDSGCQAQVMQYFMATEGERKFTQESVLKSGDVVYTPDQDVFHPACVNMVYAGSVIKQGFARGVVVATGTHTYIGAANGTMPDMDHSGESDSIAHIRRYFSRFSTVQSVLLIPVTILLTVTMWQSMTFAQSFLTALALCCTVIAENIVSLVYIIRAVGIDAAAAESQNSAIAVIKNSEASDKLCSMTDLLLLDSAAISDGKYHIESVYACGSIYNNRELQNECVHALASDLYLYRTATRPPEMHEREAFDTGLAAPIDALIKHVALDHTAIDLTRRSSVMTFWEDGTCCVQSKLVRGDYDVLVSADEQLLQHCTHVAAGPDRKPFDESEHMALRTLCRIYRETGYRLLLIANRTGEDVTIVGVLAFSQRVGKDFLPACEQLIQSGVRVSVFMEQNAETEKILTDSGLIRDWEHDVLTAMAAQDQDLDLHVAYGSYRAYLGFTDSQIVALMEKLKQRGNNIAVYSVDHRTQAFHDMADFSITCDAIEFRSAKVAQSLYDKMPIDGTSFSSRATQQMRRAADMILRRASEQGGGLLGILTGREHAFSINHSIANAMTYLVTMQFFRAFLLILPALFGTQMLSAASLLVSGLVLDLAAVIALAFVMPNQKALSCPYSIMRRLQKPLAYNVANVISACVSALVVWLSFALLQVFGMVDAAQSTGVGFLATYLLQALVFIVTVLEYAEIKQKRAMLAFGVLAGVCAAMFVAFVFIPPLNGFSGAATLSLVTVLLSPLCLLVYFVMYRILSARGLNLHK